MTYLFQSIDHNKDDMKSEMDTTYILLFLCVTDWGGKHIMLPL